MFGENIVSIRKEKGITQKELSEKTGIPVQTLVRYEKEKTTNVPVDRIGRIASALGVNASELLGWGESENRLAAFSTHELLAEIEKRSRK